MVSKGNVVAAQFHPEKSGRVGLNMIRQFLVRSGRMVDDGKNNNSISASGGRVHPKLSSLDDLSRYPDTVRAKRVIACLDVRSNDSGDLVVTKGDQYDVREKAGDSMHGRYDAYAHPCPP
jgi:glutamine amidotransferase/cyclase